MYAAIVLTATVRGTHHCVEHGSRVLYGWDKGILIIVSTRQILTCCCAGVYAKVRYPWARHYRGRFRHTNRTRY